MTKPTAKSLIFREGSPRVRGKTSSGSRESLLFSPNAKPTHRGFSAWFASRIIASKPLVENSSATAAFRIGGWPTSSPRERAPALNVGRVTTRGAPRSRDFRDVGSLTARGEFLIDHRFFHHNQQ